MVPIEVLLLAVILHVLRFLFQNVSAKVARFGVLFYVLTPDYSETPEEGQPFKEIWKLCGILIWGFHPLFSFTQGCPWADNWTVGVPISFKVFCEDLPGLIKYLYSTLPVKDHPLIEKFIGLAGPCGETCFAIKDMIALYHLSQMDPEKAKDVFAEAKKQKTFADPTLSSLSLEDYIRRILTDFNEKWMSVNPPIIPKAMKLKLGRGAALYGAFLTMHNTGKWVGIDVEKTLDKIVSKFKARSFEALPRVLKFMFFMFYALGVRMFELSDCDKFWALFCLINEKKPEEAKECSMHKILLALAISMKTGSNPDYSLPLDCTERIKDIPEAVKNLEAEWIIKALEEYFKKGGDKLAGFCHDAIGNAADGYSTVGKALLKDFDWGNPITGISFSWVYTIWSLVRPTYGGNFNVEDVTKAAQAASATKTLREMVVKQVDVAIPKLPSDTKIDRTAIIATSLGIIFKTHSPLESKTVSPDVIENAVAAAIKGDLPKTDTDGLELYDKVTAMGNWSIFAAEPVADGAGARSMSDPVPASVSASMSAPVPAVAARSMSAPVPAVGARSMSAPVSDPVPAVGARSMSAPVPAVGARSVSVQEPYMETDMETGMDAAAKRAKRDDSITG